jgi:16S rRNA (cytosine1402-N4)-methyltransferase
MHTPVLLDEVANLVPKNGVHVDATLGYGGHLKKVCEIGSYRKLIAIDRDQSALDLAKQNLQEVSKTYKQEIFYACDQFRNLSNILKEAGIQNISSALFDLGVSSMQLDSPSEMPARGFSFMRDEPLLMTMNATVGKNTLTAREIVNEWGEQTIADALFHLADETHSRRIANAICEARKIKPIETTFDLVNIIKAVSAKHSKTNPATKTFQALRMLTNEELQNIEEGLDQAWKHLEPGGRILVITFHSIEDRIVKQKFKQFIEMGNAILINKKPIIPSRQEVLSNKRARSAKLRVIQKNKYEKQKYFKIKYK